jgi:hypothetical protein
MSSKNISNADRDSRVFRDELIRRLANDCMDAIEYVKGQRPELSIWLMPFDDEDPNVTSFTSIGVAIGPRATQVDWHAHVTLGASRGEIVKAINKAIKFVEEKAAEKGISTTPDGQEDEPFWGAA